MKTTDHFWTDPPADELVQRHRIHSSTNHLTGPGSPKRPGLQVKLSVNTMSCELKMILLIGFLNLTKFYSGIYAMLYVLADDKFSDTQHKLEQRGEF